MSGKGHPLFGSFVTESEYYHWARELAQAAGIDLSFDHLNQGDSPVYDTDTDVDRLYTFDFGHGFWVQGGEASHRLMACMMDVVGDGDPAIRSMTRALFQCCSLGKVRRVLIVLGCENNAGIVVWVKR